MGPLLDNFRPKIIRIVDGYPVTTPPTHPATTLALAKLPHQHCKRPGAGLHKVNFLAATLEGPLGYWYSLQKVIRCGSGCPCYTICSGALLINTGDGGAGDGCDGDVVVVA